MCAIKLPNCDSYIICYSPWDRIVTLKDGYKQKEFVHNQTIKFMLLHELAHIKNGDLDKQIQGIEAEKKADMDACKVLLKNNDIKPIVHWILDCSFCWFYRKSSIETNTHPKDYERALAAFRTILKTHAWNEKIHQEVIQELEQDKFKEAKHKILQVLCYGISRHLKSNL